MSHCKELGKDRIIFVTKEDHETPSTVVLPEDHENDRRGLLLPNNEINWDCPCLGGMPSGPCGVQFREAFSCFHYSNEEPKGRECFEKFQIFHNCLRQHPTLYGHVIDDDEENDFLDLKDANETNSKEPSGENSQKRGVESKS